MIIRHATLQDLDALTDLEARCFPAAEAATRAAFASRLQHYAGHFWLLELDGKLVGVVNGLVSDSAFLSDAMYADASLHEENGRWQMIFGVMTAPECQGRGYASGLLDQVIADCLAQKKRGLVLTCKAELVSFYAGFGFINEGRSSSEHGGVSWYQLRLNLY